MDDGSTDSTSDVVNSIGDRRVRYVRKEHLGIPAIINAGFELCQGEYLIVCHDHDSYHPDLLATLADLLDRHPTATYSHSGVVTLDPTGTTETARYIYDYPELASGKEFLTRHLLRGIDSPVTAISMVRRSSLDGTFLKPRFGGCADVELWMRLSLVGDVAYTPRPLLRLRERDRSSVYFHRLHELTDRVLDAKQSYLDAISDPTERLQVTRRWRADATRTGFSAMCSALEHGQADLVVDIKDFVRRRGTPVGALAIDLLSQLPPSMGNAALRGLRHLRHFARRIRTRQQVESA